jgi:uncharacterized protein DUF4255/carboxypeptidase family protein
MNDAATATMMLADLDEVLRELLERELQASGLKGVTITFDAPSRDRTAQWPSPAIDLFLYDIREASTLRDRSWQPAAIDGEAMLLRPPIRLACTYAITAWTQTTLDEHRLLSQVIAILCRHPGLPVDLLPASLLVGDPPAPLLAEVAHSKDEARAEFWTAVGGQYKVSLEYTVTVLCDPRVSATRGPPVKTEVVTVVTASEVERADGPRASGFTAGGEVRDDQGNSLDDVAVSIPALGLVNVTDDEGRFALRPVPPGTHAVQARGSGGKLASGEVTVPGDGLVLTLGTSA